ncbi:glycosyltransferase family 4 protein [Streptacidiphilus carbonis]|uniref:glycosyltransferase family 4 protein n=1 Tax=Streptacidiphilus carbonis TaxID=105422 RepID=UPI0034E1A3FF
MLNIATEWHSAHGGLSTLSRRLCVALARTGATVHCLVPIAGEIERADAASAGVTLVEAQSGAGAGAGHCPLPPGVVPSVVIGHGRVTGVQARRHIQDHWSSARLLHVVHVAPDELEWWRAGRTDDAGVRADVRTRLELSLARDATWTAAVGPRLHQRLLRDLSVFPGTAKPLRLDPGFDLTDPAPRAPTPGGPVQVLLMGRMEDWEIKGVDLGAKAVAHALTLRGEAQPEVELLVRGAAPGECGALRDAIQGWAARPSLAVTVRPFSTEAEQLAQDFARATLLLMPSRAEGFGLVGQEAVVAGTPTLVSGRSGLGMLLREMLPTSEASRLVVPVVSNEADDVMRWGHEVAAVLRDPSAAFVTAEAARRTAATRCTWEMAAREILDLLRK